MMYEDGNRGAFFMKMERITNNKIKIFLTLDDLMDRGITKEDIVREFP